MSNKEVRHRMASDPQPIEFDDFATHLSQVFERVKVDNRPILVERDGDAYRLEKQEPADLLVEPFQSVRRPDPNAMG
jgi:hypothetical protein